MSIIKIGPKHNGVAIAFQHDGFEISKDGKYARIKKPRLIIIRDVNIVDHTNVLTITGLSFVKQKDTKTSIYRNIICSGRGRKTIKRFTGEWIALDPNKSVKKLYNIVLDGINYVGQPLTVGGYITYPIKQS